MQTISNQLSGQAKPLAWITGGATGIGLASAIALGQAGFRVVVSGRRQAELQSAQQQLHERSIEAYAIPLDVADPAAVESVASTILHEYGCPKALVCSAGTNVPNRYWAQLDATAFAKVTQINLNGVAFCISAILPGMRTQGGGSIVVVSSWAGWRYLTFTGAAYGASKQGLAPLVESLNDQEGVHGIRASMVCPGEVATLILRTRPKPPPQEDMDRMLKPEDVGDAIRYVITAPPNVCLNEIVIAPTYNRIYTGAPDLKRPG